MRKLIFVLLLAFASCTYAQECRNPKITDAELQNIRFRRAISTALADATPSKIRKWRILLGIKLVDYMVKNECGINLAGGVK